MKKSGIITLLLFFVFPISALAKRQIWKLKHGQVSVDLPTRWRAYQNKLGMDLILESPLRRTSSHSRKLASAKNPSTLIFIQSLGENQDHERTSKSFNAVLTDYEKNKRQQIKVLKGKPLLFFKKTTSKWSNKVTAHTRGVRYVVGHQKVEEHTLWIECKKQLFHMKIVFPQLNSSPVDTVNKFTKTFSCSA